MAAHPTFANSQLPEESIMTNTPQYQSWISRMRLPAASSALALATVLLSVVVTIQSTQAQTLTVLDSFDLTDGSRPYAAMVQGTNGSLYGTTFQGGANGYGTVFKMTPSGTLTTLYSFCSQPDCTDGDSPAGALIQASNGNFYGTTGGGNKGDSGTVFKITPSGTLTTLYNFCSQSGCTDGDYPAAGLVQASDGSFYGTTSLGGANAVDGGDGTVFKITSSGTLTTLYSFCAQSGCADGAYPDAELVQATDGNLYGTTEEGGAEGFGTIFKITPSGTLTTLYNFCSQSGCTDGSLPGARLIQATDGNLYGTTYEGGANNEGTVFKITTSGTLTTLHSFDSTDGAYPIAALTQGTDGNFYGTVRSGGANGYGTAFKITSGGTLTILYNFCSESGCPDGAYPYTALIQATNGSFYGTAWEGGVDTDGTVFSLAVGLGPFVETQPTSGKVGACINILGPNLTGATSVSFNGAVAVFKVISSSLIMANVPAGATTGKVQVVTPSRTLSSNLKFRVKP
jgi:uncharacterized repeat protein (TIGR03803 family)